MPAAEKIEQKQSISAANFYLPFMRQPVLCRIGRQQEFVIGKGALFYSPF